MIEEIKRRLDAGEVVELECVDRGGFLEDTGRREANEKILDQGPLVVGYIKNDGDIMLVGGIGDIYLNVIASEEFKYFRIKESSATFDDLIDVAVKAYKDKVATSVSVGVHDGLDRVMLQVNDGFMYFYNTSYIQSHLNHIESLYTETFVIEGSSCILKINENIQSLVLANGRDIVDRVYFEGGSMRLRDCFGNSISLTNLNILKGATVTQKKI